MFQSNNTNINNQTFNAQPSLLNAQPFSSQGMLQQGFQPVQQLPMQQGLPLQQGLYPVHVAPMQQALPVQQMPLQQGLGLQQVPMGLPQQGLYPVNGAPVAAGKVKRGHHHGVRKSRSQGVIPAALVPIGGLQQVQQVQQVQTLQQPMQMREFAPSVATETVVMPAQVIETVRTDRVLEVQPVIHREIDQSVINHIERHVTEAPAAHRGGVVQMAPIVQETVVRREIDEVQPVIHRELANAVTVRQEEHLTERIVAPTQHTNQVIVEQMAPVLVAPLAAPLGAPLAAPLGAPLAAPLANPSLLTKVAPPLTANRVPASQAF